MEGVRGGPQFRWWLEEKTVKIIIIYMCENISPLVYHHEVKQKKQKDSESYY